MTSFQQAVAAVLLRLKAGEVVTYGEVAREAGFPGAGRAVGTFLRDHSGYPWWRVVRGDGTLASSKPYEQARRLAAEGVHARDGRVRSATGPSGVQGAAGCRWRGRAIPDIAFEERADVELPECLIMTEAKDRCAAGCAWPPAAACAATGAALDFPTCGF